jgi:hypothetical protein
MDDYELERIGSDNPAQSVPAAQRAPPGRQRPKYHVESPKKQPGETQKTTIADTNLTKYDVCIPTLDASCILLILSRLAGAE